MPAPSPAQNANTTFTPDNLINAVDTANNLVNQYVVAPLANVGVAGFVFDIEDETGVDLNADITDHYVEDNSFMQDHISLQPDKITLRRFVGELVYRQEPEASTFTQIAQKITTINALVPVVTDSARQIRSAITTARDPNSQLKDYLDAGIGSGVNLYQTFKTLNQPKTAQAKAFNFLRALMKARQLVSLETPYTFYSNMAIESVRVVQPAETKDMSEFIITLKQIRTARTTLTAFNPKKYRGRTLGQASELQEKGRANGSKISSGKGESILSKWYNSLTGSSNNFQFLP